MTTEKKTSTWTSRLLGEVEIFDEETFPPKKPMDSNDTSVGNCTPWMRKLYAMAQFYAREMKLAEVEIQFSADSDKANGQRVELKEKYDILLNLFWAEVESHFDLWSNPMTTGVRKGWIVVVSEGRRDVNPLLDILGIR